jgi:predicted carbohydrate-binding protein with CBM5 and CBM33 domain/chitodextrinase
MSKINITLKSAALSLVLMSMLGSISNQTSAHGYMFNPMARQAFCELQQGYWWPEDGSNIPNAACRAAYLSSGYFQFVQAHEFSVNTRDFTNFVAVKANIPDGTLCAGGDVKKKGMNLPSPQWQRSEVVPNANGDIKIKFLATTPHNPSFWEFYISKPSYDGSTMPLTWDDVSLIQSHDNINFIKDADGTRFYEMDVSIPEDSVGDAILYSRWQRDDVVGEGFYNCSDITIVRDTVQPDTWFDAGFFLKQGQTAIVGETVSLRLFNPAGQELINQQLAITELNHTTWASDFAQSLNMNYSHLLNIGVENSQGDITFDTANLLSNITYVTNKDHTFALTIHAAPANTAPIVHDIPNIVMTESTSEAIHVHAFDDEQVNLIFTWKIPSELSYTGGDANIVITAPAVENDTNFNLNVAVSDGILTTSKTFNITVKNSLVDPEVSLWLSTKAYSANDKVNYENKIYSAKWWNKNQSPNNSSAWQLEPPTDGVTAIWRTQNEYVKGDVISYQQINYQAKWWTKGEKPDASNVWQKH